MKNKTKFSVTFFDKNSERIDTEYYFNDPTNKEVEILAQKLEAKTGVLYYDKYNNDSYDELVAEYEF